MKTDIKNFDNVLDKLIGNINSQIEQAGKSALWEALKQIKPLAQKKLQNLIWEKFYNNPEIPEPEDYERTYQFVNALKVDITQGHGKYTISVYYAPENLVSNSSGVGARPPRQTFWSYAYSWGGESVVGRPLSQWEKVSLIDKILERIEQNSFSSVEEDFQEWIENNFSALYEQNFAIKMNRIKQGKYTI